MQRKGITMNRVFAIAALVACGGITVAEIVEMNSSYSKKEGEFTEFKKEKTSRVLDSKNKKKDNLMCMIMPCIGTNAEEVSKKAFHQKDRKASKFQIKISRKKEHEIKKEEKVVGSDIYSSVRKDKFKRIKYIGPKNFDQSNKKGVKKYTNRSSDNSAEIIKMELGSF